jgi:hypothetical protein
MVTAATTTAQRTARRRESRQSALRELRRHRRRSAIDLDAVNVLGANLIDLHARGRRAIDPDGRDALSRRAARADAPHADAVHEPDAHTAVHLHEAHARQAAEGVAGIRRVELLDLLLRDELADAALLPLLILAEEGMVVFLGLDLDRLQPDRFGAHHDPDRIAFAVDHRDPDGADFIAEPAEGDVDDAVGDPVDAESSLDVGPGHPAELHDSHLDVGQGIAGRVGDDPAQVARILCVYVRAGESQGGDQRDGKSHMRASRGRLLGR